VVQALPRVKARYIIETRQWREQPVTERSSAPELLATGLSAVQLENYSLAEAAAEALAKRVEAAAARESFYNRQTAPLEIMQKQVAGAHLIGIGRLEDGLALLKQSAQIAEQMPLPRGAANPIKPAHEFYGEALLAAARPAEAAEQFQILLLRMPNRPLSLLGLARSHVALGNQETAAEVYRQLAEVWQNRDFPELAEAHPYLAASEDD
jgi:hypothetical protein